MINLTVSTVKKRLYINYINQDKLLEEGLQKIWPVSVEDAEKLNSISSAFERSPKVFSAFVFFPRSKLNHTKPAGLRLRRMSRTGDPAGSVSEISLYL